MRYNCIPRYTKMNITTIKVYQKTKISLENFKEHKKESYDEVLKKLLHIINLTKENPQQGKRLLEEIEATKKTLEKRQSYEKPLEA